MCGTNLGVIVFNKTQVIRHTFSGGWATDFGPSVDVSPDQSGKVVIPFLLTAQDCVFELDGGPHEIGGASRVNSSAVASGAAVMGVYDYWRQGTAGSPARRRVLHAGTVALADVDDASFTTTIGSGLESGKIPAYSTFDDLLIFSRTPPRTFRDRGTRRPHKHWPGLPRGFRSRSLIRIACGRPACTRIPLGFTTPPIPTRRIGRRPEARSTSTPMTETSLPAWSRTRTSSGYSRDRTRARSTA